MLIIDDPAKVSVFKGLGDGTFRPTTDLADVPAASDLASGDFNGDGRVDVVVAQSGASQLATLLGSETGTFAKVDHAVVVSRPRSLAVGDFNGDGRLDVATANQDRDTISVLLGRGDGSFDAPKPWAVGNLPVAVTAADLNRDGVLDLVVANWQSSDLSVLLGRGDGSFQNALTLPVGRSDPLLAGASPLTLVIADFNHDGWPDVATANFRGSSVSVFLNCGGWEKTVDLANATTASGLVAASGGSPYGSATLNPAAAASKSKAQWPIDDLTKKYRLKSWQTEEGLPQNTVQCLLQTRDGYLWIGTRHGLARFDGKDFKVFDPTSVPALEPSNCRCLAEDRDGTLWIGTADGLRAYRRGRFESFPVSGPVFPIAARPQGGIWFYGKSTNQTLWAVGGGKFTAFDGDPAARALGVDRRGDLWVKSPGEEGVWWDRNGQGKLERVCSPPAFSPAGEHSALLVDHRDRVWFSEFNDLYVWEAGRVTFASSFDRGGGTISSLAEDLEGTIWVGTAGGGLHALREGQIDHINTKEGLTDDTITCLHPDREGNIWVGTQSGGLNCLQPRRVVTVIPPGGSAKENVWSVSEARDGGLWLATAGGLIHLKDSEFTNYRFEQAQLAEDEWFSTVMEDASGTVWAGGVQGLFRLVENELVRDPMTAFTGPIQSLYLAPNGTAWLASKYHYRLLSGGEGPEFTMANQTSSQLEAVGLLAGGKHDMWIGSKGSGLCHFHDGLTDRWTVKEGLTSDYVAPVLADPDGTIWAASDKGLNRLKNGVVTRYTTADGLPENIVLNVLEDDSGWLWLNGYRGIHRARKSDLNAFAEGRLKSFESVSYGTSDGMLSAEGNGGTFPNSCRTRDGRLWFPTTKGMVVVDPKFLGRDPWIPPVQIRKVRANDRVVFQDDSGDSMGTGDVENRGGQQSGKSSSRVLSAVNLAPGGARVLEIDYGTTGFTAPEKIKFKYRLEGWDRDWRDGGNERRAVYVNLRPGAYHFQVIARSAEGVWNRTGDALDLQVGAFFHQTWWFYALGAAGGIGLVLGIQSYRLRVQRQLLRFAHEAAFSRERARIARDLHDEMGASLTRIALLSGTAERDRPADEKPRPELERISAIAREAVGYMSELVWAANPKYDNLDSLSAYLREFAAQFFEALPVGLELDFPAQVPPEPIGAEFRRHLFLVYKEALNNVAKHSRATQVKIRLLVEVERLRLVISDNGRGLEAGPEKEFHHGLINMRQRVESLGGTFNLESLPGHGVRLEIDLPLPREGSNPTFI